MQSSVGMVGAQLLYPDRTSIQHAGVCVGAFGIAEHYGKFLKLPPDLVDIAFMGRLVCTHEVSAVTAACLLMRKEAWDAEKGENVVSDDWEPVNKGAAIWSAMMKRIFLRFI